MAEPGGEFFMHEWMDLTEVPFDALLLLERAQIGWLPRWAALPRPELAIVLRAHPSVEWFLRHKCPEIAPWLDELLAGAAAAAPAAPAVAGEPALREAEMTVLRALEDLVVYALDPAAYDAQPLLGWDSAELTRLADFAGATVIDVGSGTGRLALTVAPTARTVYAVEPVANLRHYLRLKARRLGLDNVYVVDGLITAIPFPPAFADVTMGGHVFGDDPPAEYRELARVTRPGGLMILCPGSRDVDGPVHTYLVQQGFGWSRFEEPRDGMFRKYWKRVRAKPVLRR
jgi:protein-L-isoaspartate O-methyltransferase